jgi:hypothetical protein
MNGPVDRAAEVARFIVEEQRGQKGPVEWLAALRARWPDVTQTEFRRAIAIADEILVAKIAEDQAEVAGLRATLGRRPVRKGGGQ